jgi:hypothetical protein
LEVLVVWSFVYLALRRVLDLMVLSSAAARQPHRRDVLGGLVHEYERAA